MRRTILIAVGVAAAIPPAAAAAQTGEVVGQVVDAATEAPVSGAGIRLAGREVETDEAGMFRIGEVAAGRHALRVTRLGYEERAVEIDVQAGGTSRIRLVVSETTIRLLPLTVEALTADSARARGVGFMRGVVTREQLAPWQGTNMRFADVLRAAMPSVRIRRSERLVGSDICIELRTIRGGDPGRCLSPAVYLDGVPITNPTMLFATLDIGMIDRIEVVPAAEAGVRFGTGALFGALLIETRRPGGDVPGQPVVAGRARFDWSTDAEGHSTTLVFLVSAAGNAAGLTVGLFAAEECLSLREPARDALVTECPLLTTLGTGVAALVLPAIGSSISARFAGQTADSRGLLAPATVGSAMMILPGYALALSGQRNESAVMEWIGRGLILVGAPVAATLADYLFRKTR